MSQASKNKANRSPEASAFYTVGLILLGIVVISFIISLFWTPYEPDATSAASKLMAPCLEHPFGTDNLGRDVLSRVMSASKYTIFISAAGVAIALILGTVAGIPAGYFGGITDRGIMLLGNSIMCFPGILLALVAVGVFGPSVTNVIWALGLVFAPTFARVCRVGTMEIKELDYITHARVMGVKPARIMTFHIFPNLVGQLLESGMSYLGLGVQPPEASYGKMLSEAQAYVRVAPWLVIFPALMLIFYILGLYFVSEGLRVSLSKGGK